MLYAKWSHHEAEKKAVVIYDTMWHSTETMADTIVNGLSEEGVHVRPMHLAQMASKRYHDGSHGCKGGHRGFTDAEQQSIPHRQLIF